MKELNWTEFRQTLHQTPELALQEKETGNFIKSYFKSFGFDELVEGIAETGFAYVFYGQEMGPTTLIRCELDALPIVEQSDVDYRSQYDGIAHLCGHDGHMSIVSALGEFMSQHKPIKGKVILLFQPAEETGLGAVAVSQDPKFLALAPDYVFALHNYPGLRLGEVAVKSGPFNCASKGIIIHLRGKPTHAAHPEDGISPALAMAELLQGLGKLPTKTDEKTWVTIIHARLGEIAFGTAPGDAVVMATLRSETNEGMYFLQDTATYFAREVAERYGLQWAIDYQDAFQASINSPEGFQQVKDACQSLDIPCHELEQPMRWSEDFGQFTNVAENGAMFVLGSGEECPQLHNEHYDFPDSLIPVGRDIFAQLVRQINGLDE
ncbi:amidohydrolase [Vibrio sp. CAIM 722]|uniref:Amidohydrolase n=1 Tax=Vibrio eleionomae TaxID=2653505 RepID=A0A7X4RUC9_9VIBR|nr:amidohydrolase [Vibrio eleionomae]MZI93127.1 amidohydrolase [Vibrio eleionomae]